MDVYVKIADRDYGSRCRIAYALVASDKRPLEEVCADLKTDAVRLEEMVRKGAELLRWQPEPKTVRAVRAAPEPRPAKNWTPAELRMLEKNRIAFRDAALKKWGADP